ncbi:hypothetical protein [Companilactobacillus insicii]|uniref:hypothetical protein n=1 Tax=Companilactobacillus insicii TaxID=1732567 RepID=UPI000F7967C1|nr:hypothetical protein [Companilactobacillus insicii]
MSEFKNKATLSSNEVLNRVIELLKSEGRGMSTKELFIELNNNDEDNFITVGQLLNIQTKAKLGKVDDLSVVKDSKGHFKLCSSNKVDNLNSIINRQFDVIIENLRLLKGQLSIEDMASIVDTMNKKMDEVADAFR